MTLRVYNTLTKQKDLFEPVRPGKVGMYLCGPTVYKSPHIGHMVGPVIFDAVKRYLQYKGFEVNWIVNITDVDDKLINAANKAGTTMKEMAEKHMAEYFNCLNDFGINSVDRFPKASEHIGEIIELCEKLIASENAYAADGNVWFDVTKDSDYGKLSNRRLEDQEAGNRTLEGAGKKNAADFALWKSAKPGEPAWDSPWGKGRPGWHIECSAMSTAYLGNVFDIHGGGLDLIFPHHENELAQSRCAHGSSVMANYWMHNGFLQVEGAKMSKSDGNFVTISEALKDWPGEVLRLNMLKTHYRSPIDWTLRGLEESAKTLDDWYGIAAEVKGERPSVAVIEALSDDLNTPQMVTSLHGLRNSSASGNERDCSEFAASLRLLGFLSESAADWNGRKQQESGIDAKQIDDLISSRAAARARKDFRESDRIRDELAAMGVVIKDSKEGTTWEIAR
jgi:cysteinyl-tRNA synthetase